MERCNKCGFLLENEDIVCPLCNHSKGEQYNYIDENLFQEKKVEILFNESSIINNKDLDKNNYFKKFLNLNSSIYKEIDLTPEDIENINYILDYYLKIIKEYQNKEKKQLEKLGVEQLQDKIQKFNQIVNMCIKYQKIVKKKQILDKIQEIIKIYHKEIHYIKQYFIYPLQNAKDLLNGCKIAKTVIYLFSLFIGYFVLVKIKLLIPIYDFLLIFFNHATIPNELRILNIDTLFAIVFSIWITKILFSFYIQLTIKNKNFEVEKDKSYEIILTYTIIGYMVQNYNIYLAYFYNLSYLIYLFYILKTGIFIKKQKIEWIIVKFVGIYISFFIGINLLRYIL